MLSSFQNVHDNVFRKIFGENLEASRSFKDFKQKDFTVYQVVNVPGGNGLSQEKREKYPVIIITPSTPVPYSETVQEEKRYVSALRDTDGDGSFDTGTLFSSLVHMVFSYEIDICTKEHKHHDALTEWFTRKFMIGTQKSFVFNSDGIFTTFIEDVEVGDIVAYEAIHIADPERSDGVKDTIYQINIYPYVQLVDPIDNVPLIDNINVRYLSNGQI